MFQHKEVQEADVYKSVNITEANDLAQQIADESITLVKDDDNIMPVKNNTEGKTAFVIISEGGDLDNTDYLKTIAPDYFKGCGIYTATSSLMDSELKGSMNSLSGYDNIIVTIYAKVRFGTGKISCHLSVSAYSSKRLFRCEICRAIYFSSSRKLSTSPTIPSLGR